MRASLQVILLGLAIATATLLAEGAKQFMSGKHKRSPKQGDSPSAKEAKIERNEQEPAASNQSAPTDKEIAAAEAARARLNGDQATTVSVSIASSSPPLSAKCDRVLSTHVSVAADFRRQAARRARACCGRDRLSYKQRAAATGLGHSQ